MLFFIKIAIPPLGYSLSCLIRKYWRTLQIIFDFKKGFIKECNVNIVRVYNIDKFLRLYIIIKINVIWVYGFKKWINVGN